jgi:gas vesicle protein GvpN
MLTDHSLASDAEAEARKSGLFPGTDTLAAMLDEDASHAAQAMVLKPRADMFEDAELLSIQSRALAYLRVGTPVHFRGPAGAGKTTLALQIAARLGRPVQLVSGDASMTSGDLLGREVGANTSHVRDKYIHSVTKTETETRIAWVDSALTRAVELGPTLVYDEFTRAPPAANNALLTALEERILILSSTARARRIVRAHPDFRAILTSNPDEYAGVNAAPDALFDRMVTFDLSWCAPETEAGIVARRTGLAQGDAVAVVRIVRALRARPDAANPPSIRTALMIGRIVSALGVSASAQDERFVQICFDVLETRAPRTAGAEARAAYLQDLRAEIAGACAGPAHILTHRETAA